MQVARDVPAPLLTLEKPRVRNDDVLRCVSHCSLWNVGGIAHDTCALLNMAASAVAVIVGP
jgi:hypothetical protein